MRTIIASLLAFVFAGVLTAQSVSFAAPRVYPDANSQPSVATADFNGDGHPDLATVDEKPGTVSVLTNVGDGTFLKTNHYRVGARAFAVATGDFNGDGEPDLAVPTDKGVAILLNTGTGKFAPAVTLPVSSGATFLIVADFNGDGKQDLAVVDDKSNDLLILLGKGDGSFAQAAHYSVGTHLASLASGDFNGDGHADLVAFAAGPTTSSGFWVFLGNGDGTFQAPSTVTYAGAGTAAVGDFNGDGKIDLAVTGGNNPNGTTLGIFLGQGDGTFQLGATYGPSLCYCSYVGAADLRGDGKLDIVLGDYQRFGTMLGNGDGTFQPAVFYPGGGGYYALSVADFTGDGKLDLAAQGEGSGIVMLPGDGRGGFHHQAVYPYACAGEVLQAVTADLNLDGKPDLITVCDSHQVVIRLGDGKGGFLPPKHISTQGTPVFVAIGDLNGDGKPDLAVLKGESSSTVTVMLGNGDGTFTKGAYYQVGFHPQTVAIGDFNGDGKADMAVVASEDNITILLGNGDGTFESSVGPSTHGTFAASVDLNGDGNADLVIGGATGVSVLLGNGDGTFQHAVRYAVPSGAKAEYAMGDVNGDGHPDVVTAGTSRTTGISSYAILLGNPDGTFQSAVSHPFGFQFASGLLLADFNGDGNLDIAGGNLYLGVTWVMAGDGHGDFAVPARYYDSGPYPSTMAAADLNGDGKPDLVVVTSAGLAVLLNSTR